MPFVLKKNDGKTVVLAQSHLAKPALYFTSEYCLINAVNLAALSKLAYKEFDDVQFGLESMTMKRRVNFSKDGDGTVRPLLVPYTGNKKSFAEGILKVSADSKTISIIDTQAFHYNDGEYNVFAFRGTKEIKDFATDGYAPKHHFLVGDVHAGFHANFQAIKQNIIDILSAPENRKCKTIVTGHSLGGAIATLSAAFITMRFTDPCGQVMAYTYGSPRVGVVAWAETFSSKFIHFRHRRTHDPITMLPPHHSSMLAPTMPNLAGQVFAGTVTGMALGGIAGPVGAVAGGAVGAAAVVIGSFVFNSGSAEDAFVHHGQGILLHEGPYGIGVIKTDLRNEIVVADGKLFNSQEVLLAREFIMNVKGFGQGIGPHSMTDYFANLLHILKVAINAWDKDPAAWLEVNKAIAKQEQAFLEAWQKARLQEATHPDPKPITQDATSAPGARRNLTVEEKSSFYDDLIANAMHLKMKADIEVGNWEKPGAKERLLKLIAPVSLTAALEKEMRFQVVQG